MMFDGLFEIKRALQSASGVWVVDFSIEQDIDAALRRDDAIIAEVMVSGEITIHTLSRDDIAKFPSLGAWAEFTCSGREGLIDSAFYRLDLPNVGPEEFRISKFVTSGGSAPPLPPPPSCFGLPLRRPPPQR